MLIYFNFLFLLLLFTFNGRRTRKSPQNVWYMIIETKQKFDCTEKLHIASSRFLQKKKTYTDLYLYVVFVQIYLNVFFPNKINNVHIIIRFYPDQ